MKVVLMGTNGFVVPIFDAVKNALKLVEEGLIAADVECNPNQGEYVEKVIKKMESGEAVAKLYFVPERVFTRENVSAHLLKESGE